MIVALLGLTVLPAPARADGIWTTRTLGWGWNAYGQVGDDTDDNRRTPVTVQAYGPRFRQASAGYEHGLAVAADGTVWAWGRNDYGQLGDGTTTVRHRPVRVNGLTGVTQVAAGWSGSLALRSDGTVWAWGVFPLLGNGTQNSSGTPAPVPGMTGVVKIAASGSHALALKSDGTVWGWGRNTEAQLGDGSRVNRYSPVRVSGLGGVVSISAGKYQSLAARADGSVWAWGRTTYGDNGIPGTPLTTPIRVNGLARITEVAAGYNHSLALDSAGRMWVWGHNNRGQYGDGTYTTPPTPGTPRLVAGLGEVTQIAAGRGVSAAITGGQILIWGENSSGQLGTGGPEPSYPLPRVLPGVGPARMIAVGNGEALLFAVQADPPPPAPSPVLTLTPEAVTVPAGRSATVAVTVDAATGSFPLAAVDLPSGVTATFDPPTIAAGETSTMTITAGPDAPVRSVTVTVQALRDREPVGSALLALTVSGPVE